jgi:hypothetical protein
MGKHERLFQLSFSLKTINNWILSVYMQHSMILACSKNYFLLKENSGLNNESIKFISYLWRKIL